jgi:hypothetical protein
LRQCSGTKRDGSPCTATVEPPQTYCWWHDPNNAAERRRAASRGGRSRPSREVRAIKEEIREAIGKLEREELDRNIARAMFSGYSVLLDYIKLERGVYLEEELAARVEALKKSERENAS